jgi:hypothetical protein
VVASLPPGYLAVGKDEAGAPALHMCVIRSPATIAASWAGAACVSTRRPPQHIKNVRKGLRGVADTVHLDIQVGSATSTCRNTMLRMEVSRAPPAISHRHKLHNSDPSSQDWVVLQVGTYEGKRHGSKKK